MKFAFLLLLIPLALRAELLDTLPQRPSEPLTGEMRELIAARAGNPHNVAAAVNLARAFYRHAAREGDLRFIGYARSTLEPWWNSAKPPVEVAMMRANLRQYVHDFAAALVDLEYVLKREPAHAQALATRAAIHIVRVDYAAARADCERLKPLVSELIGFACAATVGGLTGQARANQESLSAMLSEHPRARADERLWVLLRLAEMAERIGDFVVAESRYRQALLLDAGDQSLLAAYADFLLDRGRPAEVIRLLGSRTQAEHLLLRLVLAEKALLHPDFALHKKAVADAFASARRQGHAVHGQEESRFALHIEADPLRALELAVSNWQLQRETRDARALLEAAIAARQPKAAQPVLDWMRDSGIEDINLRGLARQIANRTVPAARAASE